MLTLGRINFVGQILTPAGLHRSALPPEAHSKGSQCPPTLHRGLRNVCPTCKLGSGACATAWGNKDTIVPAPTQQAIGLSVNQP